jgi:uncharacterized protein YyaL (SSP411 family)
MSSTTSVVHSLHNADNYKTVCSEAREAVFFKVKRLLKEYLEFTSERKVAKYEVLGMDTVCHVFHVIFLYSLNADLAFYHGQKAIYFYVEFIEQISDDSHTFLQLNQRDAALFVYKKTIFDIPNDRRNKTTAWNIDAAIAFTALLKALFSGLTRVPSYAEKIPVLSQIADKLIAAKLDTVSVPVVRQLVEAICPDTFLEKLDKLVNQIKNGHLLNTESPTDYISRL